MPPCAFANASLSTFRIDPSFMSPVELLKRYSYSGMSPRAFLAFNFEAIRGTSVIACLYGYFPRQRNAPRVRA